MADVRTVLDRFVAAVDREGLDAHGIHVMLGSEEAQHLWSADHRRNIYSVSKGICVLAVGMAVRDRLISLDTAVVDALPGMEPGAGVESVTLRHLLTMTSGIDFPWFADEPLPWPDPAQAMLLHPAHAPGSTFQYSDASTYTAMRMLGAVVGDVRDWLLPRLFEPLGISDPFWQRCPLGWIMGGSGLELRTGELARIGRLLRDRGTWQGDRLVDAEWVDAMHTRWVPTGGPAPFEHYGRGAWKGSGSSWRLDGKDGQYVIIDQEREAVLTITAHEENRDHRLAELAVTALQG
jgi:CubicO group peptidase (beta-lactamase class C family)